MYRAPSGDINEFLGRLDATLKSLYNPKHEISICGDINMNYLNESSQKKTHVNSLLRPYITYCELCDKKSDFHK
jgi:hypothetical protein